MFASNNGVVVSLISRFGSVAVCAAAAIILAGCAGDDTAPSKSSSTEKPAAKPSEPAEETQTPAAPETTASEESESAAADAPAKEETPAAEPAAPKKAVDPNAVGSFSGTIVLDGEAPVLPPLITKGAEDVKDKEVCSAGDVPDESLVVGAGNGIANVFVYLRRAPKGVETETPEEPVVLDQKGCIFTPHVSLIQAGQKVLVKSSDAIQHNVHTFPPRNQSTNLLINPNEQTGIELVYNRPENDPFQVKCDIHAWMASYHLVLDHPFMALTDANGNFKIDGLPAGDYQFRIWHERGGLLEKSFKATVTGDDEPVTLKYGLDKFPAKS